MPPTMGNKIGNGAFALYCYASTKEGSFFATQLRLNDILLQQLRASLFILPCGINKQTSFQGLSGVSVFTNSNNLYLKPMWSTFVINQAKTFLEANYGATFAYRINNRSVCDIL